MKEDVFEKTYRDYMAQVRNVDFGAIAPRLGATLENDQAIIPLFGKGYRVSQTGIADPSGKKPTFDTCVILCKYLLLCPDVKPAEKDWVSYRGFKDSGPLTVYFANDVERAISEYFSGRLPEMEEASGKLGGYPPAVEVTYDLAVQFDALPRVPLMMLYNDADDEFPAKCSVLFERRAESYLDAECLAMLGRALFVNLKKVAERQDRFGTKKRMLKRP
jgi:hypothetical protein